MNNESNSKKFIQFDENFIRDFLLKQNKPVMESTLLNAVSENHKIKYSKNNLFQVHFSLFSALYKIKLSAAMKKYFLNIDTMRIRLIKIPETGCLHYSSESGQYCEKNNINGSYCEDHKNLINDNNLYFDALQEFYLNPANIAYNEDEIFKKILKGYMLYSLNNRKVNEALTFFDIKKEEIKKLKKIYHDLAKKHHPDISSDNGEMMKKINYHYQILSEIVSL